MKVVITGHTRGIGLATSKFLTEKGHEVIGLSKSNGFDIANTENLVKTIERHNPEIFINNAFAPTFQTTLLKEIFHKWKGKEKLIVNICSAAALIPPSHPDYNMPYALDKRGQKSFCDNVNFKYSKGEFAQTKCKLVNLCFDYVETSFKSKHDKRLYPNLDPNQVANVISYAIEGFLNKICFREMSFHSTREPELRTERI